MDPHTRRLEEPRGTFEATEPPSTAAPHPEELRASFGLRIGNSVTLQAAARATPAGLAFAALLVASILVPVVLLVKTRRH